MVKIKNGKLEPTDIVKIYEDALDKWDEPRETGMDNYKFVLGEQWTDEQKSYLIKHGRIPMVFNKIVPRLHNLLGTEQMNRTDIIFRPQFSNYNTEAQIVQNIWKTISTLEKVNDKLIKVWFDSLIMPIPSFIEVNLKQNEFGYLDYEFNEVNGLDVTLDPEYKNYDMSDCRFIIKEKWMTKEEITDKYGDKLSDKFNEKDLTWWQQLGESVRSFIGTKEYQARYFNKEEGRYKVLEYQERVIDTNIVVYNTNTNETYNVSKKDYQSLKDDERIRYMMEKNNKRIMITVCVPYFSEIIYSEYSPLSTSMFNLIPVTSFDFNHKKSESTSIVCLLKDIQMNYNKRQSQYTNILDNAVNSPLIVDQQDEELKREYEQRGNKPGSVFISKASSKSKPYRLSGQQADPNIINDMTNMEMQFNDISAITPALRGNAESSEESGRLFQMKSQASSASVNPYYHNLTKTRILLGQYFIETLSEVYSEPNRIISIIEDTMKDPEEILINLELSDGSMINDILNFRGFVIADEGRHSVTEQEKQFETKFAMMNAIKDPMLINWEWLLQDSGIYNVQKQIDHMNRMMGVQSQSAMEQQNIQNQSAELDNAQKLKDLVTVQQPKTK